MADSGRRTRLSGLGRIGGLPSGRGRVVGPSVRGRPSIPTRSWRRASGPRSSWPPPPSTSICAPRGGTRCSTRPSPIPTYAMGALLGRLPGGRRCPNVPGAASTWPPSTRPTPTGPSMLWVNSPSNPTGVLTDLDEVAAVGDGSTASPSSPTSATPSSPGTGRRPPCWPPGVDGVVAVHSLSKRSNLAGVRAGFFAGDPELVGFLADVRRHAGLMVPGPVQAGGGGRLRRRRPCRSASGPGTRSAWTFLRRDARPQPGCRRPCPPAASTSGCRYPVTVPGGRDGSWPRRLALDGGLLVSPGDLYGPDGAGLRPGGRGPTDGAPGAGGRAPVPATG